MTGSAMVFPGGLSGGAVDQPADATVPAGTRIAVQPMHVSMKRKFYGKTEFSEKNNMRKDGLKTSRMLF